MYRFYKTFVILLNIVLPTVVVAQQTVNTAGANANGTGGSACYSVGQIVYSEITGASKGYVIQGVQQPFEISVVSGVEKVGINLLVTAFPNPVADDLTLKIVDQGNSSYQYELLDLSGKKILSGIVVSNETFISMKSLPDAVYLLHVSMGNSEVKTFKIIKK